MSRYYRFILVILVIISIMIALVVGSTPISLIKMIHGNHNTWQLIINYRLPRILVAVLGGALIGISGLLLQSVLRNQLVDTSILGIMNGSQFLLIALLVLLPSFLNVNVLLGSFAGLILTAVWFVVLPKHQPPLRLILLGIATAMTFQALTNIASEGLGVPLPSLSTVSWPQVMQLIMVIIIGCILITLVWPNLKYFALPPRQVKLLGISEEKTIWIVLLAIGLWTGALTSLIGIVFFLGAILPEIARFMNPKQKSQHLIWPTALWGSLLLLNADTIARTVVAPKELPASAILLAISGPLFGLMLIKGGHHARH
ncbi:iron ABC transporter permease [Weissella paramesenteroides]|uniref:FecCD family ABC transporter permease n=1 Tax=Weissella paramesenteroides TaxID=1249 RepID=UPI0023F9AC53|nr:iron ABC transporter permease [Weissella paramesenteroides]MDF8375635.1 iron ABC transporter permease [Weissella paramesenteroides]